MESKVKFYTFDGKLRFDWILAIDVCLDVVVVDLCSSWKSMGSERSSRFRAYSSSGDQLEYDGNFI